MAWWAQESGRKRGLREREGPARERGRDWQAWKRETGGMEERDWYRRAKEGRESEREKRGMNCGCERCGRERGTSGRERDCRHAQQVGETSR